MELLNKLMGISVALAEEAGTAPVDPNAAGAEGGAMGTVIYLLINALPFVLIIGLMYFLMIRPERKKRKKEQEMLAALKRGDRVCTIGGIYGTIIDVKDDTFTLSVGRDKMTMVVARWAIRSTEDVSIENESEALN